MGQPTDVPTLASADAGENADVCALATDSEVEVVLGQAVTNVTAGTDADSISGGTLYFCTYLGQGLAVVISLVEMNSPEAAGQAIQEQLAIMQSDDPSTTTVTEKGLGDQAFWSTSSHAGAFTVVKGARVFSVSLGGSTGDPSAHKEALRSLAESIATKL